MDGRTAHVHLLSGPFVTVDDIRFEVPEGSKRLLAFVAIKADTLDRRYVAGSLWPSCDDGRAAGNLRSALWRMRGAGIDVVAGDKVSVSLADGVLVDAAEIAQWADRLVTGRPQPGDFYAIAEKTRALDILPGCYDDWAVEERERMRQRVMHALEQASRLLCAENRFGEAIEAAMAAVFCEPLRESAQRSLVEAHLAEGNLVEARRSFGNYARLVRRELGIGPSQDLCRLVQPEIVAGSVRRLPLGRPHGR